MAPLASPNVVNSKHSISLTKSLTAVQSTTFRLPHTPAASPCPPAPCPHRPPLSAIPAQALNVRPRLPAEAVSRSRTPPTHLAPSPFDYDVDFSETISALLKGKGTGKDRGKGEGKEKGKGKNTPTEASPPDSPRHEGKGTDTAK